MKVGEYIRTNKGIIDKLTNENIMIYEVALMGFGEKPIKSSPNIIDLIEVGDYVNGYEVMESKYHYMGNNFIDFDKEIDAGSGYGYQLLEKDIKSIVTKEQFSSMKYKVN